MNSTQSYAVPTDTDSAKAPPPLRHAYPLPDDPQGDDLIVRPGMVARCGHVRTEAEGAECGDVSGDPLDPCMVCVALDQAAGGNVR